MNDKFHTVKTDTIEAVKAKFGSYLEPVDSAVLELKAFFKFKVEGKFYTASIDYLGEVKIKPYNHDLFTEVSKESRRLGFKA
jgi:hypothetical protein